MAGKQKTTGSQPVASMKIRRDRDWEEWVVKAYDANGHRIPEADYHTDDKADAESTARAMTTARGTGDPQARGVKNQPSPELPHTRPKD